MNKAITDGVNLMPPAFGDGLTVWSSQDGTPGSATYDGATNASLIASDADFGTCLELLKTEATQKLRYMGEIPMLPGCYVRVKTRVKMISGNFTSVRIAGWAGGAGGAHITGLVEAANSVSLDTYGQVVEISAIIGSGRRTGVDLSWGLSTIYGHFGLDLVGADGGVVRIEDFTIEDVTSVFHRKMMDVVDVTDYGAVGDGVTDNATAFEAADADAQGRDILVPEGIFHLGQTVTMNNRIRFEGYLDMPDDAILQLTKNFDFLSYEDAFGDEVTAFKKGIQALFNFTDHDSFDLRGRAVNLPEPIDVHAVVGNIDTFSARRLIRNGQLVASSSAGWDTDTTVQTANYSASDDRKLKNVTNVQTIAVGSLVSGNGVGREVYVTEVDVPNNEVTLSLPLYGASASQSYTFTRFKYMLDFSGFTKLQRFIIENVEFSMNRRASGILIAPDGKLFQVRDCYFSEPADRGISSSGKGCAGLQVDRNQFLLNQFGTLVDNRTQIGVSANSSDLKIRNNRSTYFKHFAVLAGSGHIISGNHNFQGDGESEGNRSAGYVFSKKRLKVTFVGNYVDNCFIEWTNERDSNPNETGDSFHLLSITGNIFMVSRVAPWFTFIRVKPYGSGQYIQGLSVTNNVFRNASENEIERVETADTSFAPLNYNKTTALAFHSNSFNRVINPAMNPLDTEIAQTSATKTWTKDLSDDLPFGCKTMLVTSAVSNGAITNSNGSIETGAPYYLTNQGSDGRSVSVVWPSSSKGKVRATVRGDVPLAG